MIRVSDLHRSFGEHRAVSGVSFEIERGEIVGFLGPNGAGKSTTMRVLAGVAHADRGEVSVAGHRLPGEAAAARAQVGYLPEHTPLYASMRVDRYLEFAARARGLSGRGVLRPAIGRALERAGLEGFERRRILELSKGYRQRVGLAQAMVGEPPVLLLDEPTSGLDPLEGRRLRERIAEYAEDRTVLFSTHVLSEVEALCHRAIMLFAGRLVADGPLHDLAGGERDSMRVALVAEGEGALPGPAEVAALAGADRAEGDGPGRYSVTPSDAARFALALHRFCAERGLVLTELSQRRRSLEQVFAERAHGAEEARP